MALYKNLTKIIFALTIAIIIPSTSWASGDFWSDKQDVYRKCIASKLKAGDDITINVNELLTDCVQPVAGPDLLVESASMLFPETATRILVENNDGTEVSVVSLIFRNLLYKSSDWIFREIGFNPLDAYIDDSNYFANKTAIHKYSSKGSSGLAAFGVSIETGLKYVLRLLGYLSASLCLLVIFRRMGKAAYDGLGAMDIMVTTIKESPPIILALYLTAPPSHGGMPIIGEVMVAFLIFGALMSNVFSVFLTEVIYLFYGDGVVSISAGMDSDSHDKDINKHLQQYIERTSDNIVALDIIASNYLTKEIGLNKSNNAEFRVALEKHPFPAECILRPYWEMKIFSDPRCVDLKKYAIGKMSYEQLTWVKLHIKNESEMIPYYVTSGKPQNASNALYNEEMVKALLDEAYSRADSKKAAICAMNPKLGNLNSYKGEWLCNQFDQKKGAFIEGSYLAPEYYNYLNNLNGEFPVESARKIAANYYLPAIDDNVTKSTIEAVKASARIQSSWVISELQNSIDVRSFTIRGIITSLWNSIYISNVVTKIAYQLQGEYISHHQKFFSYLNVLSPEIKTQPNEWVIDEDFKDENNLAATFAQFKKLSPTREEKESGGFLDINPDTIFAGLIGISPVACRNDNTKCLNLSTNPLSKIGGQVGIILNFSLLFTVGAHFISSIFNNADWATGLFEFLATATGGVAIALIAFTILPFFTYFFYSVLKVFVRVLVYTIAAPLVIVQFIIRKNSDEQYDEDNIFIPKDILGMGLRLLVDFLSISIALIGGLVMVYINISILTIMVSYITSAISIDESLSLLNLKSIISYSIVLLLTLLAYIYSIYKAATLQPYIQEKVSEFAYTGFNLSTDKDNEAEVILGVLTPALGLLNNKE